jgi:hypothetical protein
MPKLIKANAILHEQRGSSIFLRHPSDPEVIFYTYLGCHFFIFYYIRLKTSKIGRFCWETKKTGFLKNDEHVF